MKECGRKLRHQTGEKTAAYLIQRLSIVACAAGHHNFNFGGCWQSALPLNMTLPCFQFLLYLCSILLWMLMMLPTSNCWPPLPQTINLITYNGKIYLCIYKTKHYVHTYTYISLNELNKSVSKLKWQQLIANILIYKI